MIYHIYYNKRKAIQVDMFFKLYFLLIQHILLHYYDRQDTLYLIQ